MSLLKLFDCVRSFLGTQSALKEKVLPILKELGLEPVSSSPNMVTFFCSHEGYRILVGIALLDTEVLIQAMSNIQGVDSLMRQIIKSWNKVMSHKNIRFVVTESSRMCVQSRLPFSDLNSETLDSQLREILPEIRSFDEGSKN